MKKVLPLCITLFALPLFAQLPTWTSNNSSQERYADTYNNYDYELWNQDKKGTATMKVTGDNGQGTNAKGGTFEAEWNNTCNVLFRSGKKWGMNSTQNHTQIGNMTIDFDATWSSTDGARYLSVYGWAFFTSANTPNNFSNEIEYYIVQDRGGYDPTSGSSCVKKGTNATIDGIEYGFHICDRIGQPKLNGNGNFKQFFSVPTSTGKHRTSGIISISEHFKAWHARDMHMDGPMYEVAMKIESYNCNNNAANGKGSGKVTKNILTIGGTPPSSSSSGGTSSSSATPAQACTGGYQTSYCGGAAFASVLSNSTAMPSQGECLFIGDFEVIQPDLNATVSINGVENVCGADWDDCPYNDRPSEKDGGYYVYVKSGKINDYENSGWQGIVAKAKCAETSSPSSSSSSPSSASVSSSSAENTPILSLIPNPESPNSPKYYTLKGEPLGSKLPNKSGVYIVKQGYSIKKIVVR